jgi:hypothetical protein
MFLLFILMVSCEFQMRILKTPIFHLPIKHHSVLLSKKGVYSIDFTPVENIRDPKVLLKLLLGKNIRGELRLRYIDTDIFDKKGIIAIVDKNMTELESRILSDSVYKSIKDHEIKTIIKKMLEWGSDSELNLYKRNCQHFCNYVIKILDLELMS